MDEFIKKLIERLEEYKRTHLIEHKSETPLHCQKDCYEYHNCTLCTWDKAIEIVNQLAEEYADCYKDCEQCKAYDKKKHHCPKFCMVIKDVLAEMEESRDGWTPCSERLPDKRDWYLAVFQESDTGFIGLPFIADYLMGEHTNYTTEDGWIIANCTDIEEGRAEYYKKLKCIAYQPLPAPYQPKGE